MYNCNFTTIAAICSVCHFLGLPSGAHPPLSSSSSTPPVLPDVNLASTRTSVTSRGCCCRVTADAWVGISGVQASVLACCRLKLSRLRNFLCHFQTIWNHQCNATARLDRRHVPDIHTPSPKLLWSVRSRGGGVGGSAEGKLTIGREEGMSRLEYHFLPF